MYKYLYILLISISYISNSQPLEVIYYYDNGYISSKGYIENNKPNGYWFNYYDSGIIKSKGNRINFLLEGEWFFYDEKGHKKSIINYEEGIKKGEEYIYLKDTLLTKNNYENGKLNGTQYYYYKEGNIKETIPSTHHCTFGFGSPIIHS